MRRGKAQDVARARGSFALTISGLALFSVASIVVSLFIHDPTTAIVGCVGLALVAAGLFAWSSGRWVRRAVTDRPQAGSITWPIYAQTNTDSRYRRGILTADESALVITLKAESVRLEWFDVHSIALRPGSLWKSGLVLIGVPTRGMNRPGVSGDLLV
jgi:hypothetical protein